MPFKFYIENTYERTEIQEPDKWKDIISVLDRDFNAHGMFFNYTEGTLKLGFACDAKIDLEAAYQADGTEAYYLFEVDEAETIHDTYTTIFSGEIDFSTRNYPEDIWEAEVNTSTNQLLLKNRAKNKIGLNKSSSIDGLSLGLMNKQTLAALATKTRDELIIENTGAQVIGGSTVLSGGAVSDVQIGFDSNEALGIKNYENLTTEVEISGAALSSDYFLRIDKPRAFKIDVIYDYELDMTEQQGSGTTAYTASLVISLYKNGKDLTGFGISLPSDSSASPNNWSTSDSGTKTFYRVFEAGTEFRAILSMVMSTTGNGEFDFDFTINQLKFSFVDLGTNTSTVHDWYNVHDSLNKILNHITDKYDFLYSEILGGLMQGHDADGCLSTLRQTNGYRMRQITDNSRAPILSFNNIVENLNVIQATGYGIEELESPVELGLFDVVWGPVYDPEASVILQGDQTYDIIQGDKIGFYNSPDIYGRYDITGVVYDSINDETTVFFDISANEEYHTNFAILSFSYPVPGNTYQNVFITCDSSTTTRERLRVENWEHFYSQNELIDLGVVEEYREEPFNEAIYNQINLGFKKYGNDEESFSSRDDFHTNSQWSLPLRKSENVLSKIASWIGSTFMINESRDTLFSEKPTVSHKLDDDIFICDRSILIKDFTVSFAAGTNIMTVPEECYENYLVNSALIKVSGSVSNDGAYLYSDVSRDLENSEYDITLIGTLVNEASVLCTIEGFLDAFANNRSVAYKAESNENTIGINNLSSPEYTYNLRRSIKRFLFRWGDYIVSSMSYLGTQVVRNLFFINNGELTSQYGYDADCVDFFGSIVEQEDVSSTDLGNKRFKPNIIHATKYICNEDYQTILDAHKNKLVYDDQNYGYITVTSPRDSTEKSGWLMEMKRSPLNKIAQFKLLERYVDPVDYPFNLGDEIIYASDTTTGHGDAISVVAPNDGAVNTLRYYSRVTGGDIRMAIYSDSSGSPAALLGKTNLDSNSAAAGWKSISLISQVNIEAGNTYWIAITNTFGASVAAQVQLPGSVSFDSGGTDFGDPAPTVTPQTRRDSIYMIVEAP